MSELRGLFLELDPLDTGRVPYTRLQDQLEARGRGGAAELDAPQRLG